MKISERDIKLLRNKDIKVLISFLMRNKYFKK
jgi:hypothetical protein